MLVPLQIMNYMKGFSSLESDELSALGHIFTVKVH